MSETRADRRLSDLEHRANVVELTSYFQPVFNLRTGRAVGVEALMRPITARGDILAPETILERARREGLLLELERKTRSVAVEQFSRSRRSEELILFLNFSATLLDGGQIDPGRLSSTIRDYGLSERSVAIEIVESGVRSQDELAKFARRNRDAGFLISLDDFGTKHSNLERITVVRPDIIKIDRSIISGTAQSPVKRSVLRSITYLARTIGALSLAEGVEVYEDLLACAVEGVELAQGYLLGRPQPTVATAQGSEPARESLSRLGHDLRMRLSSLNASHRAVEEVVEALAECFEHAAESDIERIAEREADTCDTFECIYVIDDRGVQLTRTIATRRTQRRVQRHAIFQPAGKGTDHSLKDYVYAPLALGHRQYVTEPYLSLATGEPCRTWSRRVRSRAGRELILCVDIAHRE